MPNWFKYQTDLNKTLNKEGNCQAKSTRADYNSCMAKYTYTLNNQRKFLEKWQKAHPLSTSGSRPTTPDPLQAAKNQVARQKAELAAKKLAAVAVAPTQSGAPPLLRQDAYKPSVFSQRPSPPSSRTVSPASTPRSNASSTPSTPRSSIFMGGKRRKTHRKNNRKNKSRKH